MKFKNIKFVLDQDIPPKRERKESFEKIISENFVIGDESDMIFHLSDSTAFFTYGDSQLEIDLNKNLEKFKSDRKQGKDLFTHALGDHRSKSLEILDGTAGLGVDFCHILHVMMKRDKDFKLVGLEKSPIVYTLLKFSLMSLPAAVQKSCHFICSDTSEYIKTNTETDIIYLDPMFEEIQKKKSLSSRPMEALKVFCGPQKGEDLLAAVLQENKKSRLIVKRPLRGKIWFEKYLAHQYKGKNIRYDLYHKNIRGK